MSAQPGDDGQARLSPLRSTSMPTEPEIEPLPPSWEPVERQMVDLFFDRAPFGLAVFDLDGRLQRCNRTWTGFYELYFGAGPEYTAPGRHLNDLIPGNEQAIADLFLAVRSGHVVRQAAHRIAIPGITTYWDVVFAPLFEDGELVGVLDVVTDATDRVLSTERLEARIRAFTTVSAAMTVDQPLARTLATVREQVMLTTPAIACSVVTWLGGADRTGDGFTMVADPGFGPGYCDAVHRMHIEDHRDRDDVEVAPFELRRNARTKSLSDPRFEPVHAFWREPKPEWDDLVVLPLLAGPDVFGQLHVHFPEAVRLVPDDVDFLRALADQAALSTQNAALFAERAESAATEERQRLARDLHDSVSQALFSMTLHARTAERRLEPLGDEAEAARTEVRQLQELTRGALAEMRALIFELRPDALAEEGLGSALTKQGAAMAAREQIAIEVDAPSARLPLSVDAEEHLYRIALEAMHNAVKHAYPSHILVSLVATTDGVQLLVSDDGIGFDTAIARPGHLGLGTMRERALGLGGSTQLESAPGAGTRVRVTVPAHT